MACPFVLWDADVDDVDGVDRMEAVVEGRPRLDGRSGLPLRAECRGNPLGLLLRLLPSLPGSE